jgi:acyl-CoA synthetase (AMP-forming)/AMP-acid ligase II
MGPFHWASRPDEFLRLASEFQATLCWLPNFAFSHMTRTTPAGSRYDLSRIRAMINCSEPCRGETLRAFAERFRPDGLRPEALQACYAMAETVFAVTQSDLSRPFRTHVAADAQDIVSAGVPIDGMEIRILGEDGAPAPERTVGEIALSSPMCLERYRGDPTPARDGDGWYRTGDVGVLLDGELYVIGRKDDVIITRGKKIVASEVETALLGVEGLKAGRCAALGITNPALGTQELVIVYETTGDPDEKALRRTISRTIEYRFGLAPAALHRVESGWIVKSSSGKIARGANAEKLRRTLPAVI